MNRVLSFCVVYSLAFGVSAYISALIAFKASVMIIPYFKDGILTGAIIGLIVSFSSAKSKVIGLLLMVLTTAFACAYYYFLIALLGV
jgi:hypothetical protein